MGFERFSVLIAGAGLALAASLGLAAAQDVCAELESQLVALDNGGGERAEYAKLDRAVQQQREQLDGMTAQARREGCMGGFFFKKKRGPNCGALTATIERSQANLKRLQRQRNKFAGDPFATGRQRNAILRALASTRCSGSYGDETAFDQPRRRGFFATLFGGRGGFGRDEGLEPGFGSGTYKTVCVRTCDGYYFPISFSATPSKFAADEQVCQAQCPGAPVALYTFHNPGQDIEQAVSLTGEPYTMLPTAFQYRQAYDRACSCKAATATAAAPADPPGLTTIAPVEARPLDSPAPDGAAEANAPPTSAPEPETPSPETSIPEKEQVRIVGPPYFVAQ